MAVKGLKVNSLNMSDDVPGLVLLNTTSFSGVASQSLPASTFSSTYDNYLIVVSISATTADSTLYIKLRASGTDSSANYYWTLNGFTAGGTAQQNGLGPVTTGMYLMDTDTGSSAKPTISRVELYTPFVAQPTSLIYQTATSTNGGIPVGISGMGLHTPSTSYDSATLVPTAGNISGSMTVYGMNK